MQIPTAQSVGGNSHANLIDAFNLQLRQQPWYQDWFRAQGLNPNQVHLSKGQRQQLEQLIVQRAGVPADAFNDMMIDPAGNLNTEHGFASQPTWLKALEIGGAAAAGAFAAPGSIGSLVGMGSTSAPAVAPAAAPTILTGAGPMAASSLPAIAGPAASMVPTLARTGFSFGKALTSIAPNLVNAGTQLVGAQMQSRANDRAAELQRQTAQDTLAYTERRDAQARQDMLDAQNKNFGLYQESQARLDPYRQFGLRSLAQIGRPIPGVGTLASRM